MCVWGWLWCVPAACLAAGGRVQRSNSRVNPRIWLVFNPFCDAACSTTPRLTGASVDVASSFPPAPGGDRETLRSRHAQGQSSTSKQTGEVRAIPYLSTSLCPFFSFWFPLWLTRRSVQLKERGRFGSTGADVASISRQVAPASFSWCDQCLHVWHSASSVYHPL